ncbi:MAG: alpha-L-fucosidase C-terminal domain-containing protein [Lentisphaeria bacterium]|nr:alpha-L-fucosidase C-terminal domain-containing protein [Lentisphaeria bacterium]
MAINSEAIYGTTSWKVDKEGPYQPDFGGTTDRKERGFNGNFTPQDVWFTAKDNAVYAITLVWPKDARLLIASLAGEPVESVSLLGCDAPVQWEPTENGLSVTLPEVALDTIGCVLKVIEKIMHDV